MNGVGVELAQGFFGLVDFLGGLGDWFALMDLDQF